MLCEFVSLDQMAYHCVAPIKKEELYRDANVLQLI